MYDDNVIWYYGGDGDAFTRAEPLGEESTASEYITYEKIVSIILLYFHMYVLPSSSNYHDYVYIMEIWCEQKSCQAREVAKEKKMYGKEYINIINYKFH